MPRRLNKIHVISICAIILIISVAAGIWGYHYSQNRRAARASSDVRRAALIMQSQSLQRLAGAPADKGTPDYDRIKNRLAIIARETPDSCCTMLLRYVPEKQHYICLADSLPENTKGSTQPGTIVKSGPDAANLQKKLDSGAVVVGENNPRPLDEWLFAYAPINDGDPNHIVRTDISARSWNVSRLEAAILRALYPLLLLGLPFATFLLTRLNSAKSGHIKLLRAAFEQSALGILFADKDGRMIYVNNKICSLLRYTGKELTGRPWMEITPTMSAEQIQRARRDSVAGKMWVDDFTCTRKDGEAFRVRVVSAPVKDDSGKILAVMNVVYDSVEIERRAADLRLTHERGKAVDKARNAFLAAMNHEVRAPLNCISDFLQLLLDTELTPEQRNYVNTIHTSAGTLRRLSENILDYSHIESGLLRVALEAVDVRAMVKKIFVSVCCQASEKNLHLVHDIAPDMPRHMITDGARLQQILTNLVGNAVKYTPAGEVKVTVRPAPPCACGALPASAIRSGTTATPFSAPVEKLCVEYIVTDTGIGIEPEDQLQLFKPFMRFPASRELRDSGAGLGLTIAYDLVRLLGGSGITATSIKGKGSTFSFVIPCGKVA